MDYIKLEIEFSRTSACDWIFRVFFNLSYIFNLLDLPFDVVVEQGKLNVPNCE